MPASDGRPLGSHDRIGTPWVATLQVDRAPHRLDCHKVALTGGIALGDGHVTENVYGTGENLPGGEGAI